MSRSAYQLTCLSWLRHAVTRILAEEPRLATAAVGTSRRGRVVIRHLVESLIGQFRQLAQRLQEACHPGRLCGVGRRRQDQENPGTIGLLSLRGVPEPVVSDLVKASRQDVLKEASEELNARQPLGALRVGAAVFPMEMCVAKL